MVNACKVICAANYDNIIHPNNIHYRLVKADINDRRVMEELIVHSDPVMNFATESHVDNF